MDVSLADPDGCALVCDGQRLSYRELTARRSGLVAGMPDERTANGWPQWSSRTDRDRLINA